MPVQTQLYLFLLTQLVANAGQHLTQIKARSDPSPTATMEGVPLLVCAPLETNKNVKMSIPHSLKCMELTRITTGQISETDLLSDVHTIWLLFI